MPETKKQSDKEWAKEQVEKYADLFPLYEQYADALEDVLKKAAKEHAPLAMVQARPKKIVSFAEKIQRKKAEYKDPISQFTDLCGARVITHTPTEVKTVCEFIEKHFDIDWDNTIDVSQRLKPTEFGYRSVHYIVKFKPGIFPTKDIDVVIPQSLFDLDNPRAEVQVRTILEHAWADFSHDRSYKSAFRVPEKWERELAAVAAILESADKAFDRVHAGLQAYAANYGDYMTPEQVRDEIAKLETVLEIILERDLGDAELVAHRIGKLAIALGDWRKAVDVLSKHVESGYQPLLRELGVAMCKLHKANPDSCKYQQGQRYLEVASAPPGGDIDALASLAGTWKGIDDEKARELYRRAFEVDSSDPYPLGNYLEYEVTHQRNTSLVSMLNPVIHAAIQRCRDQIDVGMNLPWAFYDVGKFHLLLGKSYESLAAYTKAVQLSTAEFMIDTSLDSLDRLAVVGNALPGHQWARRLLLVGRTTKFPTDKATAQLKEFASPGYEPISGPVVIMVGGCDAGVEEEMEGYRDLILDAFRDFKGTIISGGTTAGVSGLVGTVQKAYPDAIRTIGYVPKPPADVSIDKRYNEIRYTEGEGFSALEPLQNWIDLIASEIHPSQVRVLGINGGEIAAAEYRIALALGALVAVIEDSGREAAKLLPDDDWGTAENLLHLPADTMTVRAFIGSGIPKLSHDVRETLAKTIHEKYRQTQMKELYTQTLSMAEWGDLLEHLKESNRQQADHIFEKLRQIGYSVHDAKDREISLVEFNDNEVEIMAEVEHARWNAERLLDGWTWGEKKDVERKVSPYLVSWEELPENVKEWDRQTVRAIPELLAKVGLEIRKRP